MISTHGLVAVDKTCIPHRETFYDQRILEYYDRPLIEVWTTQTNERWIIKLIDETMRYDADGVPYCAEQYGYYCVPPAVFDAWHDIRDADREHGHGFWAMLARSTQTYLVVAHDGEIQDVYALSFDELYQREWGTPYNLLDNAEQS